MRTTIRSTEPSPARKIPAWLTQLPHVLGWVDSSTKEIHWLKEVADYTPPQWHASGLATIIYLLLEPHPKEIRYVGKTVLHPARRLYEHLRTCQQQKATGQWKYNYHNAYWLRSLRCEEKEPIMVIIDVVTLEEGGGAEAAYLEFYQRAGCRLTNTQPGGDGQGSGNDQPNFGKNPSKAARRKTGHASRGKHPTEATRAKMSRARQSRLKASYLKLIPVIEEIIKDGAKTYNDLAQALNERKI